MPFARNTPQTWEQLGDYSNFQRQFLDPFSFIMEGPKSKLYLREYVSCKVP